MCYEKQFSILVEKVREINPGAAFYLETAAKELNSFVHSGDIWEVMMWGETPQGGEFWKTIADKLGQVY